MITAVLTESAKALVSTVVRSATVLFVVGIGTLSAAMSLAAGAGNAQVSAKLGPLAEEEGWPLLTGAVAMITAPAGLLGFGVVLSWIVGREFSEATVSGLFALPVSRRSIAAAKLVVFLAWSAATAIALTVTCMLLGLALGYGIPSDADLLALSRLLGVAVLTGLLAVPTAWVATLGRGLLPGIALAVMMIALGQILVIAGTGAWFPIAAPALWAVSPPDVNVLQLLLVPTVALVFAALTTRAWHRLELDR